MRIRTKPAPTGNPIIHIFGIAKMRKQRNILFFIVLIEFIIIMIKI